jgi:hypothetical protein
VLREFGVEDWGLRVQGSGFRVQGTGEGSFLACLIQVWEVPSNVVDLAQLLKLGTAEEDVLPQLRPTCSKGRAGQYLLGV